MVCLISRIMFCFIIVFLFLERSVHSEIVRNVRVIDHSSYFTELMQETMYEVEERGWCNLKLLDQTQDFDETIYSWDISGEVTYTSGFVVSVGSMDLQQSTVRQIWSFDSATNTSTVSIEGMLRLHEVAVGYDIVADMSDGDQHFTGIFTHERIDIQLNLLRNVDTDAMSSRGSLSSLSGGTRRMIYMPENHLTEFLSRHYTPSSEFAGVGLWASGTFAPILLEKATNTVEFPGLCYNCNY